MHDSRYHDSPPRHSASLGLYPPHSSLYPPRSSLYPWSQHEASRPAESIYEERPQFFYNWFSPPGLVKTFQGVTILMCFLIFVCVASTLVWDMHGHGAMLGGYGLGPTGAQVGYYGGTYGYASSYMTPYSAKSAMISMAAINFLVSLGFLVGSFSRSRAARGRKFYLAVLVCDVVLAVLQGIMDIVFVIGVNPASQSSQSVLYNPMLRMCQTLHGPSLSGSMGSGFPGGFPMYNQYLQHYCFMDPEEAVALVLGLLVVIALIMAAYYAYKTRSKIWRHGKANIYWERPLLQAAEGQDVQDWVSREQVNHVAEGRSTLQAPTLVICEREDPLLQVQNSVVVYGERPASVYSEGTYNVFHDNTKEHKAGPSGGRPRTSEQTGGPKKSLCCQTPQLELEVDQTGSSTAGETAELRRSCRGGGPDSKEDQSQDQRDLLYSMYPEISCDKQRQQYRREFAAMLQVYRSLCTDMDDISDQLHKLSRELDSLDESSVKYQGVADEYNHLKDLKRTPDYQTKRQWKLELRRKLCHIKQLVKNYDSGLC